MGPVPRMDRDFGVMGFWAEHSDDSRERYAQESGRLGRLVAESVERPT